MKTLSAYVSDSVHRLPLPHAAFGVSLVAYKSAADVVSKTVTLLVTVAAARALPAGDFGVLALAMTTGWLLGVASDAGLPMFAATRVANAGATGDATRSIAGAVMRWRSWLAAAAGGAGILLAFAFVPPGAALAFTLIVWHQLLGAMLDTMAHVYRGLGRTDVESTISLAHRGAIALAALTVLAVAPTLLALAIALVVPPLVALVVSRGVLRRVTQPGRAFALTPRAFVTHVAPLGAGVLLSALYFRIDVYFIERFHDVAMVGHYNAAFRLVDAIRLLPAAGLAVAYPMLCAATDLRAVSRITAALACTSLPVAAAIYIAADRLLSLIYGDAFAAAAPALRLLSLAVPLFFVNYALTHQVIAWQGERAYMWIAAAALLINVAANIAWIPDGGMVGAAYSTLVTEVVVCVGCLAWLVRR